VAGAREVRPYEGIFVGASLADARGDFWLFFSGAREVRTYGAEMENDVLFGDSSFF